MAQCLCISMEILGCPSDKIPLLAFLMLSRGKPSNTHQLQELPERMLSYNQTAFGAPVFFWVDSFSLSYPLGDHKAMVLFDP